jgi:WD40 repeat protein/tetratricopeptide (TPR) repeat protein
MSETVFPLTPYKGLMPYTEEDAPFFFGREAEREIITANLMASRLTLLYGASGVGKSSVLRAGVAHHLRQLAQQNLAERGTPEFVVVVFSSWRDDPVVGLAGRIQDCVTQALNGQTLEPVPPSRSLVQTLQAWTERVGGDLLIILDQFEEYFLYHPDEDGEGTFAVEFPRAVNRPDLRVSFLISIREDALAKLDRFKGRIPNLFDNYLRIEHLDREAARAAIEEPIQQYNRLRAADGQQVSIEQQLVEAVLEQVEPGQILPGDAGRGIVKGQATKAQIETPYLQLVMTRLWDEEMRHGSHILRLDTLDRLGRAKRIVETHLDEVMSTLPAEEQDIAARVFHYLVTPSGTKIAHTISDLAKYAELPGAQLTHVLEELCGGGDRILRPVAPPPDQPTAPRYEIFHDVLAPAILDWRARYLQQQELAEVEKREAVRQRELEQAQALAEEQQRRAEEQLRLARRLRRLLGMLVVVSLLVVGVGIYAWTARGQAEQQARLSFSRELAAAAINNLGTDPERSVFLALHAASLTYSVDKTVTLEAENALHRAVQALRVGLTLSGHTAMVVGVAFSPDGTRLATASYDRTAMVWHASSRRELLTLAGHTEAVNGVAFSPDGARLATASDDRTAKVWDVSTGRELLTLTGHTGGVTGVAFSPDGARLATASADKTAKVWDASSGRDLLTLAGHIDEVVGVAFSLDDTRLATTSHDWTAKVWDASSGRELLTLAGHISWVRGLAFSRDGARLATASNDQTAKVWDAFSGRELLTLAGHMGLASQMGAVFGVAFSPVGTRLATTSRDRTAKVWDVSSGGELLTLAGHTSWVVGVAFSPDGARLATASDDRTAKVWDVSTGRELLTLAGHTALVYSVAFSHDGTRLATASDDGTVRVYALNIEDLVALVRTRMTRPLTSQECQTYLHEAQRCPLAVTALNHVVAGNNRARAGDVDSAVASFRRALVLDPTLRLDPEADARRLAAEALVGKGQSLAKVGDVDSAVTSFRRALELDPNLRLDPEAEARQFAAEALIGKGSLLVRQSKVKDAIAAYAGAERLDSTLKIPAKSWNTLCWFGSLWRQAGEVMFACERAVQLEPENWGIRDRRGVARAMTGNINAAIEDFQEYIKKAKDPVRKSQRQHWIDALRAGEDPFTDEEIKMLFYQ